MNFSVFLVFAVTAHAATENFDDAKPGPLSTTWEGKRTGAQTGSGTAKWSIEKDDTAPSKPHVLKQSDEAQYPAASKNDTALKDEFVRVKFKPASCGEVVIDIFQFTAPAILARTHRLTSAADARTAFLAVDFGFCLAVPHRARIDAARG